jgi:hypothetical protein
VLERVGDRIRNVMKTERYLLAAQRGVASVTEDEAMFAGILDDDG